MKEEFQVLLDAYKSQDVEQVYEVIINTPQFNQYADLLLYERNAAWIPDIEQYIKSKPTFIAVGAGHLGSERGVLALLRKAGYTVTPVIE